MGHHSPPPHVPLRSHNAKDVAFGHQPIGMEGAFEMEATSAGGGFHLWGRLGNNTHTNTKTTHTSTNTGIQVDVYAFMYALMYACVHVCMYACMHACVCACMHVCMRVSMYVCMYAFMYACVHVCMHACMHACMYACEYNVMLLLFLVVLVGVVARIRLFLLVCGCWFCCLMSVVPVGIYVGVAGVADGVAGPDDGIVVLAVVMQVPWCSCWHRDFSIVQMLELECLQSEGPNRVLLVSCGGCLASWPSKILGPRCTTVPYAQSQRSGSR